MKTQITEKIQIPEGVSCSLEDGVIKCSKSGVELSRNLKIPRVEVKTEGREIVFNCERGNKIQLKSIRANLAHLRNMFLGLEKKYVYSLESCNVHFPMILKVEKDKLIINNFLGEKVPRTAVILPNVEVQIKGAKIAVSSHDREAAGQTAANFEKATIVRNRDRRVFQDGIYITEKPGREL
ncbi:50S ribosomal protein L6 [Candidatus Pacearchaeota archaeon]|nr:50S ribosomal protein L6 [Candidatus Pacearchaeota archaeon]